MKIKTLISVSQKGAHRFISLLGNPEDVQKDIYYLFNIGIIQEIPEEYRDGKDDCACVVTSDYKLNKVATAAALASLACAGRRHFRKLKDAFALKKGKYLAELKESFRGRIGNKMWNGTIPELTPKERIDLQPLKELIELMG